MTRPDLIRHSEDYARLIVDDVPLLDVRAPIEFDKGAIPGADNLPLLDDEQREQIGTHYARHGQDSAVDLGHQLATPQIRASRIAAWSGWVRAHPDGCIYCFRGGLRSRITQQWLVEAGIELPYVEGGYKAMRGWLMGSLDDACSRLRPIVVGGFTGSGKTEVVRQIPSHLDLEGLANHRGSAFGKLLSPQPTQINFEHALARRLLQMNLVYSVAIEDEGRMVGSCHVPIALREAMQQAPIALVEQSLAERTKRIVDDYVESAWPQYQLLPEPQRRFDEFVLGNLYRIRKRLGMQRYAEIRGQFESALRDLYVSADAIAFTTPVSRLLAEYYDPMYEYQLGERAEQIVFRGEPEAVIDYCRNSALSVTV